MAKFKVVLFQSKKKKKKKGESTVRFVTSLLGDKFAMSIIDSIDETEKKRNNKSGQKFYFYLYFYDHKLSVVYFLRTVVFLS